MTLAGVRSGRGGSSQSATGRRSSPPAASCHAVKVSGETGVRYVDWAYCAVGRLPLAAQHRAAGHGDRAAEPGHDADRIERRFRRQDQERNASDSRGSRDDRQCADRGAQKQAGKHDHDQRLDRPDRGGDAARKPIGGDEEKPPEDREVESAENEDLGPPDPMRKLPHRDEEKEAGGKCAQHGHRQRIAGRQQLGRDQIGASPDGRRDRRHEQVGIAGHRAPCHLS